MGSVCLLTFSCNEDEKLGKLLDAVGDYVDEIVVVDSSIKSPIKLGKGLRNRNITIHKVIPLGIPDAHRFSGNSTPAILASFP